MAITWLNTIKAQFKTFDINHMKQVTGNALKLDDYESVKTWAGQIWAQVDNDLMPPDNPWSSEYKQNFKTWMDSGMPLGDQAASGGTAPSPAAVTWATIKGQFTQLDIDHMKQVTGGTLDLSSYASTKASGSDIYSMVGSGQMPPGHPWSPQYVANFKAWMDAGYPQG